MDPRFLTYYNRELQHIRAAAEEFSREHPKVASRLGIESFECADPYVERLLEGFSFVAARIQLKLENQFDNFILHLLEMVYPHYLCQIPAIGIVEINPNLSESSLSEGYLVKKGAVLKSTLAKGQQTPCQFTSTQDVTLWPLQINEATYLSSAAQAGFALPTIPGLRAGLRINFSVTNSNPVSQISLDQLVLHLRGSDQQGALIYEQVISNCIGIAVKPPSQSKAAAEKPFYRIIDKKEIRPIGFDKEQSLLPYTDHSFDGYRVISEFFHFPQKFQFVEISGLKEALVDCELNEFELVFLFDRAEHRLENSVNSSNVSLHCTPVINLFEKRCDRISIDKKSNEFHVLPDRTRPMDLEVFQILEVMGYGADKDPDFEFRPFYSYSDQNKNKSYYTMQRKPRAFSSKQKKKGPRSSYLGTEVFISLIDSERAISSGDLKQIGIKSLCTNRDLPLMISTGRGATDLNLVGGAPVSSVRFLSGPTKPRASSVVSKRESAWKLISHLSLNYLSLVDNDRHQGAAALREMLSLYCDPNDQTARKMIDGIKSVSAEGVTRRLPFSGPVTFGRGLRVDLHCEEYAFEGTGLFLFGAAMNNFLQKYVSLNSFVELKLHSSERGEIHKWPVKAGKRDLL
ncbi:type VI secretion system baseplate subunit TssF [Pelagibaculum spongiae]|uniref:Type VI secretion system baseplate subunit TssF n=1 Tax=Pelagibaculum spongiae TaxID=2080658 RepID=A0A2V1GRH3_9GAMM|nr:type VI secretion system baseplate subunit TssF [Pelagibaculum spongiae]PVZ67688.1 type VI secretion system baseplate subunit TssF [Pelagibaculum spongiae]